MSVPQFSVPISSLDAAGRAFHFPVPPGWVRGVLEESEATTSGREGALDVRLSKSGNDVVVHGTLRAELQAPCARCLEPVRFSVEQPVSVLMVPASQLKSQDSGEYEFSAAEADTLPYDGETVILDDLVKDELVLGIPMTPLCREDCPGMTPGSPGEPDNPAGKPIDPRLLPLMRLKQQTKS
jgi:uncharacterized protein